MAQDPTRSHIVTYSGWILALLVIVVFGSWFWVTQRQERDAVSLDRLTEMVPVVEEVVMPETPTDAAPPAIVPSAAPALPAPAVQAPGPTVAPVAANPADKPYAVQVASFKEASRAARLSDELKAKGRMVAVASQDLKGKGVVHKVLVGEFANRAEAEPLLAELRKTYPGSFLIHR